VLDLFSRTALGWAMAPNMPAALVSAALRLAIQALGSGRTVAYAAKF